MFILLNENGELRSGWKALIYIVILLAITFPVILLFKLFPKPFNNAAFALLVSTPLANWCLTHFLDQKPLQFIGLDSTGGLVPMLKEYILGFLAGGFAMGVIAFLLQTLSANSFELSAAIPVYELVGFTAIMFCVGIYEELQVRGYLLRVLADGFRFGSMSEKQGLFVAVAFTSALFGFLHLGNPNTTWISTLNIALAGVLLSYPILVTGRLYISFGLHFSWNWFQGGFFGMPVSGGEIQNSLFIYTNTGTSDLFTGGAFGPEAGIVGLIGMFVACLPVWYIYKKQNNILRIFELQFNQQSKADTMIGTENPTSIDEKMR